MALTMVPYLFGYSLTGAGRAFGWFSWLGYNLDDSAVYLSWLRQAADGHFFQRNLFTTESQPSGQFNLFFLALGLTSKFTTVPVIAVWHLARILLGLALLRAVYGLIERLIPGEPSRKSAFLLVCFSAGLGWIPAFWQELGQAAPVDVWQPEANTFLSLYLNPLFVASLLLMVGFLIGLIDAERSGSLKPAALSGLCGFLLGNIHGYDVITLAAIWSVYLVVRSVQTRRIALAMIAQAVAAFLPAFITSGYQYYLLKSNPIFAARVNVATLSPPLPQYLLGYGFLIPLALLGLWMSMKRTAEKHNKNASPTTQRPNDPTTFLLCWLIANLAVAYLPVPFQRKMIMGFHLPLCMLGGICVAWIASKETQATRSSQVALIVLITAFTNIRFLLRDMSFFQMNYAQSTIQRPYLMEGERRALEWLRTNAKPGTPIQPLPWIRQGQVGRFDTTMAAFAPGLTGLPVDAGHWGETPNFESAIRKWSGFASGVNRERAAEILRTTGVRYVLSSQKLEPALAIPVAYTDSAAPLLRRIPEASNDDADVYEVVLP